jgi:hypothetical protein
MAPRTIGALAMRPTGNAQGNYYFFSLSMGRIINRSHATKLPMPDNVIARVHVLARQQKVTPGLVFSDYNCQPYDDDEHFDDDDSDYQPDDDDDASVYASENNNDDSSDDSTYYPPDDEHDSDNDDDGGIPGVNPNEYEMADEYKPEAAKAANDTDDADDVDNDDADDHDYDNVAEDNDVNDEPPAESAGVSAQDNDARTPAGSAGVEPRENENDIDTDDNQPMIEQQMDAKYGPCNQQYDMRRRKQR